MQAELLQAVGPASVSARLASSALPLRLSTGLRLINQRYSNYYVHVQTSLLLHCTVGVLGETRYPLTVAAAETSAHSHCAARCKVFRLGPCPLPIDLELSSPSIPVIMSSRLTCPSHPVLHSAWPQSVSPRNYHFVSRFNAGSDLIDPLSRFITDGSRLRAESRALSIVTGKSWGSPNAKPSRHVARSLWQR
jgi:hypothetical protein